MGLTVMGRYSRQELLEGWTLSEEEAGRMRETLLGSCKPKKEKEEKEDSESERKQRQETLEETMTVRVANMKDKWKPTRKEYCGKSSQE